jgi:hypothetical protein
MVAPKTRYKGSSPSPFATATAATCLRCSETKIHSGQSRTARFCTCRRKKNEGTQQNGSQTSYSKQDPKTWRTGLYIHWTRHISTTITYTTTTTTTTTTTLIKKIGCIDNTLFYTAKRKKGCQRQPFLCDQLETQSWPAKTLHVHAHTAHAATHTTTHAAAASSRGVVSRRVSHHGLGGEHQ